ncbi:MAG: hypothetical protein RJQ10_03265 [Haliea sp.]|uniref:hypothetical protein n=1 Tax=Haliea sp. TaxID=1932666 RepID=UPI0032EF9A3D
MNESELVAAFQGYVALTNQLFFGYVSLLSGFLVMSYLVADRISSLLASISAALFSIVSVLLLFGMYLSQNNAEHIMAFMRSRSHDAGFDLAWLGYNPLWAADLMSVLYIIATVGGYLASLTYFIFKRRHGHLFHLDGTPQVGRPG